MKRKIREAKSKVYGTKQILSSLNQAAHREVHMEDPVGAPSGPTGAITMFGGPSTEAPDGWLYCDGTAVSRTTYALLFALIGTTYGVGDGSTTFNVPNMQDRFPVGKGVIFPTVGATGGSVNHSHTITVSGNTGSTGTVSGTPSATTSIEEGSTGSIKNPGGQAHTHTTAGHTHSFFDSAGTSSTNNPPYITINYIIKF